jgi:DNA-binding transcriptional ArsR family regulator
VANRPRSTWRRSARTGSALGQRLEAGAVLLEREALGDPNRRAIAQLLGAGERSVQELADSMPISRPAVSRHLRLLKSAGLVTDRAEGTRRLYRLHDEGIEAVRAYLEQVWGDAATRFKLAADNR